MANSESRRGWLPHLIIVHTNEGDHKPGMADDHTAEDLVRWMITQSVSYHKIVDDDSTVTMVPDDQAAWSARSANQRSLNICLTGWSRWSRTEWLQHQPMLNRAAGEVRNWSHTHGIPLVKLTPAQVGADARGVCGHGDWSVGKHDGDHSDPGRNFPWDVLLALPGQSARKVDMFCSVWLEPTARQEGEGHPNSAWSAVERVIATGGASKATSVFGNGGGWIQAAWWGERGQDIISPARPLYVEQFKVQHWTAPDWAEYLTIRYAAPAGGSVALG